MSTQKLWSRRKKTLVETVPARRTLKSVPPCVSTITWGRRTRSALFLVAVIDFQCDETSLVCLTSSYHYHTSTFRPQRAARRRRD
jgi:hypothetical protein